MRTALTPNHRVWAGARRLLRRLPPDGRWAAAPRRPCSRPRSPCSSSARSACLRGNEQQSTCLQRAGGAEADGPSSHIGDTGRWAACGQQVSGCAGSGAQRVCFICPGLCASSLYHHSRGDHWSPVKKYMGQAWSQTPRLTQTFPDDPQTRARRTGRGCCESRDVGSVAVSQQACPTRLPEGHARRATPGGPHQEGHARRALLRSHQCSREPALGLCHPCLGNAVVSRKAWPPPFRSHSSQPERQHRLWSLQSCLRRPLTVTGLLTHSVRVCKGES